MYMLFNIQPHYFHEGIVIRKRGVGALGLFTQGV